MSGAIPLKPELWTPGKLELWTSNSFRRFGTSGDSKSGPVCEPVTQRSDGHPDLHFRNGGPDGPDARRMLACWNACDGVPTDMLEKVRPIVVGAAVPYRQLVMQRDGLLEALQDMVVGISEGSIGVARIQAANAAIAKATQP